MGNIVRIQHPVDLIGQPTSMTCWMAATSMLLRRSVTSGTARTAPNGGLLSDANNLRDFARSNGLRLYYGQTWMARGLIALLRKGPAAMMGRLPSMHAVVLSGIESDGTEDGTYITIHDPWPVRQGTIHRGLPYAAFLRQFPMASNYMLQP